MELTLLYSVYSLMLCVPSSVFSSKDYSGTLLSRDSWLWQCHEHMYILLFPNPGPIWYVTI